MKDYDVGRLEDEVKRDTVKSSDLPDFGILLHVQAKSRDYLRDCIIT